MVKNHRGLSGVERGKGNCYQWREEKDSVRKETKCGGHYVVRRAPTPEPTYVFVLCFSIRLKFFFFFEKFYVHSGTVAEDVALSRPSALGSEVTCPSPPWPIVFSLRVTVACRRLYFGSVDGDHVISTPHPTLRSKCAVQRLRRHSYLQGKEVLDRLTTLAKTSLLLLGG